MASLSQKQLCRMVLGLCCAGIMAAAMPQPASAGFFERLFGGFGRRVEAPPPQPPIAFADPLSSLAAHFNGPRPQERVRGASASGPARAFCVRTCDGHYFPVQAHAGMSAADACHSFCPASETRLYVGGSIDYATASDGSRYSSLPNAFAYRKALVSGCTCNGRNAFGLAHINPKYDPTLRPGDVVATSEGLQAFTGRHNSVAEFTPVQNYSPLPKSTRDRLAETRIASPSPQTAAADPLSGIPLAAAQAHAEVPSTQSAR
jgi:hypothetical protein